MYLAYKHTPATTQEEVEKTKARPSAYWRDHVPQAKPALKLLEKGSGHRSCVFNMTSPYFKVSVNTCRV